MNYIVVPSCVSSVHLSGIALHVFPQRKREKKIVACLFFLTQEQIIEIVKKTKLLLASFHSGCDSQEP